MEKVFHEHVATAFTKVETEFEEINSVVQGVHNAGAGAGNASTASLQIAQQTTQARTARIEA